MRAKQVLCFNNSIIYGEDLAPYKCTLGQRGFRCIPFQCSGSVVVDSLFIVSPIVCGGLVFGQCLVIRQEMAHIQA